MRPKPVFQKRGQEDTVSHLEYSCKNEKTGCNYVVQSNAMTPMEMKALREDGTPVRL